MILLDTNAIVYYLYRVEPYASKVKQILIERKGFAVSLRVIDEVIFTQGLLGYNLQPRDSLKVLVKG